MERSVEVYVDGISLEYVSEFKYLGSGLHEPGTDGAKSTVVERWQVGGRLQVPLGPQVNTKDLQL